MTGTRDVLAALANRRLALMLPLGFASGLPLALTSGTLQAWLTVAGVDLKTIGLFGAVALPYTVKFLWAPIMDRYVPPLLGRRRGWMALMQIALGCGIAAMAAFRPGEHAEMLAAFALLVAFLSASHDIAFDAYRADVLHAPERGLGAGLSVTGYRLGMLLSGALALILSDLIGWTQTYLFLAACMGVTVVFTLCAPEPEVAPQAPPSLAAAVIEPFRDFLSRPGAIALLALVVLYKLGDAFAGTLTTAFLIRGLGHTATEVGVINKGLGLAALLGGALLGGLAMTRLGLYRGLLVFGFLQAVTNLGFLALALTGKSALGLALVVALENAAGGMGTVAFVALLMTLCNARYTATQFALLSALASVGRVMVAPPSGYVAEWAGWPGFFLITFLVAVPGLVLLVAMKGAILAASAPRTP